jgi:hypothetical protein
MCIGDEEPTDRVKNIKRKENYTGSVGAPTREAKKMITVLEIEKARMEQAHIRKHTSVEGACYSAGCGDPHREEHSDEGKRR